MKQKMMIIMGILLGGCIIGTIIGLIQLKQPSPPMRLTTELNLSQKQNQQMQKLHEEQQLYFQSKMAQIKNLHTQLDSEFLKNQPDETKIISLIGDIKAVQMALMTDHFNGLLKVRQILTQDQFKKMVQTQQKLRGKADRKMRHKPFGPNPKAGHDQPPPFPMMP